VFSCGSSLSAAQILLRHSKQEMTCSVVVRRTVRHYESGRTFETALSLRNKIVPSEIRGAYKIRFKVRIPNEIGHGNRMNVATR